MEMKPMKKRAVRRTRMVTAIDESMVEVGLLGELGWWGGGGRWGWVERDGDERPPTKVASSFRRILWRFGFMG